MCLADVDWHSATEWLSVELDNVREDLAIQRMNKIMGNKRGNSISTLIAKIRSKIAKIGPAGKGIDSLEVMVNAQLRYLRVHPLEGSPDDKLRTLFEATRLDPGLFTGVPQLIGGFSRLFVFTHHCPVELGPVDEELETLAAAQSQSELPPFATGQGPGAFRFDQELQRLNQARNAEQQELDQLMQDVRNLARQQELDQSRQGARNLARAQELDQLMQGARNIARPQELDQLMQDGRSVARQQELDQLRQGARNLERLQRFNQLVKQYSHKAELQKYGTFLRELAINTLGTAQEESVKIKSLLGDFNWRAGELAADLKALLDPLDAERQRDQ
jgi:hypothetical protein